MKEPLTPRSQSKAKKEAWAQAKESIMITHTTEASTSTSMATTEASTKDQLELIMKDNLESSTTRKPVAVVQAAAQVAAQKEQK